MLWIFIGFNALPFHSDKSEVMERLWAMTGTQLRSFEDTGGNLPKVLVTSDLSLALTRSCVHLARFSSLNNLGSTASSINASLHPHRPYLSSLYLTSRVCPHLRPQVCGYTRHDTLYAEARPEDVQNRTGQKGRGVVGWGGAALPSYKPNPPTQPTYNQESRSRDLDPRTGERQDANPMDKWIKQALAPPNPREGH
jgi:hypothetical protein